MVAVGQGFIRDELWAAKGNSAIQAFRRYGLFATWAPIALRYRDGVLAYLAEHYNPKVPLAVSATEPVAVELP